VLLYFSVKYAYQRDGSREDPQASLDHGFDGKAASESQALVDMLNVNPERGGYEHGGDVNTTENAVQLYKTTSQSIRKLHGR
jgi:hypothetical protein